MKYLWIGSFLNEETYKEMRNLGYKNPAAYQSQTNILEGLESICNVEFDSICVLSMVGYPFDKVLKIKRKEFSHSPNSKDVMVGFCNPLYLNRLFGNKAIRKEARNWALKQKKTELIHVFIYEMRSSCMAAAAEIKKVLPLTKIHLIVPDLPQYMDLTMSWFKKKLKQLDWKFIEKNRSYVDDYILYAGPMADQLGLSAHQWMLMEGTINSKEVKNISKKSEENRKTIVMYSGGTQLGFGMEKLLKVFDDLSDDFELWITGSGDAKDIIKEYASRNSKIKYYGFLDTREELAELQQKATVLINMRDPQAAASNYCFPSKLFEYMLTGKPVLSFKMGGIPQEYYDYLLLIDNYSLDGIRRAIEHVRKMTQSEMNDIGERSRKFVSERKTNLAQSERIAAFVGIK